LQNAFIAHDPWIWVVLDFQTPVATSRWSANIHVHAHSPFSVFCLLTIMTVISGSQQEDRSLKVKKEKKKNQASHLHWFRRWGALPYASVQDPIPSHRYSIEHPWNGSPPVSSRALQGWLCICCNNEDGNALF